MEQNPSQKAKICSCNKQSLYTDTAFANFFSRRIKLCSASSYKPKGLMHIKFSNFRIQRFDKIHRKDKGNLKFWALN